ncbi:MAG: TIGR01777 family protein [Chloroflexi bacterium]|nr:TIGR01777 family protein [Chloroflexota bacterium]MYF80798.1 TIGR01777 family protein [Chloroflexota bacterium]MYI04019.1 TIGR01777 family protein [Chloroflexota bacterium]
MHVVITGASGLVGGALIAELRRRGVNITAVSRNPRAHTALSGVTWTGWDGLTDAVAGAAGVVHLAGEGIVDQRWSSERKAALRSSRVETTRQVVQAIQESGEKPGVLVSASAIGYYGNRVERESTESAPAGDDFLAHLCVDWEAEAQGAGVRTVTARIGITLANEGGALPRLLFPFKLGLGGPIGLGRAWWSWVHIDDVVGGIIHALEQTNVEGALNLTAPNPVRNGEFSRVLGRVLGRPALIPVPPLALKLMLGEGASVLLASQRILPTRTLDLGYRFRFTEINAALEDLIA